MLVVLILLVLYLGIGLMLYFFQEGLLFFPQKLPKTYSFSFDEPFEEMEILTESDVLLHGLLFQTENTKGLIFYLHGNAGALDSWGEVAPTYTSLGYDVFLLDYPGYGKSEGKISSQAQLFKAVQDAYNEVKKRYQEDQIIVLGYSIGTGLAAYLAANNHPKKLILQAPYYSLVNLIRRKVPIIPSFLIRYPLETHRYLKDCTMPVVLFHGAKDSLIPVEHSERLQMEFKKGDTLIILPNQEHNGITDHPDYKDHLIALLP
jgi:pimeloyl-ACP methyl ester carboxylesterase